MKKLLLLAASLAVFCVANALTYNVTVPAGTKACYIVGEPTGWSHTAMTKVTETSYTITIDGATEAQKYKYCSGPLWVYVEKGAAGEEVSNRTYSDNDVVATWATVYEPDAEKEYVDITIKVQYAYAPTIWWWGAGDKCKDAKDTEKVPDSGEYYQWNETVIDLPVMTPVEGAEGWYEWNFKDVDKSLGVQYMIDGEAFGELKTTESVCYDELGGNSCPEATAAEEVVAETPSVVAIYNMIGQPVSADAAGLKIFVYSNGTTEKKY